MTPDYYVRSIHGVDVEVRDIADAWDLGRWETQALQYLLRADWKEDTQKDLQKAADCIQFALEDLPLDLCEGCAEEEDEDDLKQSLIELLESEGFHLLGTGSKEGIGAMVFGLGEDDDE